MKSLLTYIIDCGEGCATPGNTTGMGNPALPGTFGEVGTDGIPKGKVLKQKVKKKKKKPVDVVEGILDPDFHKKYNSGSHFNKLVHGFCKQVLSDKRNYSGFVDPYYYAHAYLPGFASKDYEYLIKDINAGIKAKKISISPVESKLTEKVLEQPCVVLAGGYREGIFKDEDVQAVFISDGHKFTYIGEGSIEMDGPDGGEYAQDRAATTELVCGKLSDIWKSDLYSYIELYGTMFYGMTPVLNYVTDCDPIIALSEVEDTIKKVTK